MKIALYDFDGTIYKGDSSVDYALFCLQRHPSRIPILLTFSMMFILYKTSLVSKQHAKSWLFRLMDDDSHSLQRFWESRSNMFVEPVVKMLKDDANAKIRSVVVSASPRFLVSSAMALIHQPMEILATETETNKPYVFLSPNCFGQEKVKRLMEWKGTQLGHDGYIEIVRVVSDSLHDLPLYGLGGTPFHVLSGILEEGLPDR